MQKITLGPAMAVVGLLVSGPSIAPPALEPPNVVLVMADDQGWGDMTYQGHKQLHTPNFDALAREGFVSIASTPLRPYARRLEAVY